MRLLPARVRQSLYYRWFATRHTSYPHLFKAAPLSFAPATMYDLVPGDVISGNIAFSGFYELALSREIVRLASGGGLLVDVGANMGYFTLLWAAKNPQARAVTFEAAPRNLALLATNIERNRVSGRVLQIPKAAGDHRGEVAFDLGPPEQSGWGGIAAPSASTITVPLVRLDEEITGPIDVLKIDVEGADTWVLFGCESLLRRKMIRHIFFEQNAERMARLGIGADEAAQFLARLGYRCERRGPQDWYATP